MEVVRAAAVTPQVPQDELKQALSDFRDALPAAEQQQFDASKQSDPFEGRSVMLLTSQIDSKTQSRFSRCLAPKLIPFLNCVDAFSGAVDTFVSANPHTAALVWGAVKVFLMFACNFGQYFEKLTDVLRSVGETSPKLAEYGTLFQSSQSLQDALTSYYTVVIRLCRKAVFAFQRQGFAHIAKTALRSFEKEFEPELADLQARVAKFQEELSLAKTRIQVEEAKFNEIERSSNSSFRTAIKKFNSRAAQQLEDLHRWQLESRQRQLSADRDLTMQNLSTIDPSISWRRIKRQCIGETGTWFKDHKTFLNWISDNSASALCHLAHLGGGKTTTFANVVEHLILEEGSRSSIAYIFCQSEDSETLLLRNVVGCICRQLLEPIIKVAEGPQLQEMLRKSRAVDTDSLISMVLAYPPAHTAYVLLDGLDELHSEDAAALLRALSDLSKSLAPMKNSKIFLNCRPDQSTGVMSTLKPKYCISAPVEASDSDMSEFIRTTLDEKLSASQLVIGDPELILVIQDTIERGAKGMFLWARLFIEHLCLLDGDIEIFHALSGEQVPDKLADIYDRIISRLETNATHGDSIRQTFLWAAGAKRPLATLEMREAISIRRGQTSLSISERSINIERVISFCGGLVVVDDDDDTIHLVHSSLIQHLVPPNSEDETSTTPVSRALFKHDHASLDREIFLLCATYLKFSDFNQTLTRMNPQDRLIKTSDFSSSTTKTDSNTVRTAAKARQLLQRPRKASNVESSEALGRIYQRLRETALSPKASHGKLAFLAYAKQFWVNHIYYLDKPDDTHTWTLFESLVNSRDGHINKPWEDNLTPVGVPASVGKAHSSPSLDSLSPGLDALQEFYSITDYDQRLTLWAFRNGVPSLLHFVQAVPRDVKFDSYKGKEAILTPIRILNSLSKLIAMGPREAQQSMKLAVYDKMYDKAAGFILDDFSNVVGSYLIALWDLPRNATPVLNHTIPADQINNILHVPDFESVCGIGPPSRLARENSIGRLGKSWSDFPELRISPLGLAIICNHKTAFYMLMQLGEPSKEMRRYCFDSLVHTIVCCREEMFHEIMELGKPYKMVYSLGMEPIDLVLRAVERGLSNVALVLLARDVIPNILVFDVNGCNTLLMYAVEFRDIAVFGKVLSILEDFVFTMKTKAELREFQTTPDSITTRKSDRGMTVRQYIEASLEEDVQERYVLLEMLRIFDESFDRVFDASKTAS